MATMLPPDPLFIIQGPKSPIHCLAIRENVLYAGTQNGHVHLWSVDTYREIENFTNGTSSCISLIIAPHLNHGLIIQDKEGKIRIWERNEEKWIKKLEAELDYIGFCKIQLIDNGRFLLAPLRGPKLKSFSLDNFLKTEEHTFNAPESGEITYFVTFEKDNESFVILGLEIGKVILYNFTKKTETDSMLLPGYPSAIEIDTNSNKVIVSTKEETIVFLSISDKMRFVLWKEKPWPRKETGTLALRADKKLIVAGCSDGHIVLFSWKFFNKLAVLTCHESAIQAIIFSKSQPYLFFGACQDGKISVWDLYK